MNFQFNFCIIFQKIKEDYSLFHQFIFTILNIHQYSFKLITFKYKFFVVVKLRNKFKIYK